MESGPMASSPGPMVPAGLGENLSLHGSNEKLNSSAVNRILMEFLMYFGKAVALFYPVYLTGYLGLSISWVLLCMMMVTWWKKNRQWKDARIGTAINFFDNEAEVVSKELENSLQMASWVCMKLLLLIFKHPCSIKDPNCVPSVIIRSKSTCSHSLSSLDILAFQTKYFTMFSKTSWNTHCWVCQTLLPWLQYLHDMPDSHWNGFILPNVLLFS